MRLVLKLVSVSVGIIGLAGLVYWTNQTTLRQGANDPQIQMSQDRGLQIPNSKVDLTTSLTPYIMVFDETGKYEVGNALLDGKVPEVPIGVLDYARTHGQNRVTWQPKPGVRQAVVVTYFSEKPKEFVLVGRSLIEVEKREDMLFKQVVLATAAILSATLALVLLSCLGHKKAQSK